MSECRVVDLKELGISKEIFDKIYSMGEEDGRADAIEEFDIICEETRNHKLGVCASNYVIDVIKAKVKEQLKKQR